MLTRQHYKAIAEIIKHSDTLVIKPRGGVGPRNDLKEKLADYFQEENPQFDRDKFLTNCGLI